MDINEIGQEYNKLPQETREIIIKFIEHKSDLDMQQVIREIQGLNKDIQGLEKSTNIQIQGLEKSTNTQIKGLEKSTNTQIKVLYWVIGIIGVVIALILALKK